MFVWQSTYDTKVKWLEEQLRWKESSRVKTVQEYEQLKIVHRLDTKAIEDLRHERDALKSELEELKRSFYDPHSEDGLTVGLIDAILTISSALVARDVSTLMVQDALAGLRGYKDLATVMDAAAIAKRVVC